MYVHFMCNSFTRVKVLETKGGNEKWPYMLRFEDEEELSISLSPSAIKQLKQALATIPEEPCVDQTTPVSNGS